MRARRVRQTIIRAWHRPHLPPLLPEDQVIADGLERDGAYVTSLDALASNGIVDAKCLLEIAAPLFKDLGKPKGDVRKSYVAHASENTITANADPLLWGLNGRILSIVENYIGMPVAYRGITVRRDFADGQKVETRLWHRDAEDRRIVKIIVYINDVDEQCGPFCYIPKTVAPRGRLELVDGRVPDSVMGRHVAPRDAVHCTGPAGTVIFTDTCAVFHRGALPIESDRLTIFYIYNSQAPLEPEYCQPLFDRKRIDARIVSSLDWRQTDVITFRY